MDQFSLLHLATGIIAYFFGIKLIYWFILHVIFEILENTELGMKIINSNIKFWPGGKPKANSFINRIGDTFFSIMGWQLAYLLDTTGKQKDWY